MIHIFYSTIKNFYNEQYFFEKLQTLPYELQKRNLRYIRKEDQYLNLLGKLLLMDGLNILGYPINLLEKIIYNEKGCPYFDQNIHFSISHSGKYAICAISDNNKIGIDIEMHRQIKFEDYKIAMNDKEWELIHKSKQPLTLFFRFWTIKECFIKGLQMGMSIPINKLNIKLENMSIEYSQEIWYIRHIPISWKYSCTIASPNKLFDNNIHIYDYRNKY